MSQVGAVGEVCSDHPELVSKEQCSSTGDESGDHVVYTQGLFHQHGQVIFDQIWAV